ncbi:Pyroglutamyl-peptidase 1 [Colletotrichum spinosum]|uniref:Pyroglutamyl-peptidase 1 n=1 Tax=Colletotrichum spinosum TaxID=1347390 RepID=A0A4R8PZM0_9PEZI|nr:Pyroglutamyl-peptidase 1 [Colletotrichum spinosum]
MTLSTADDVFVGFDVSDKDKPFLMDVLAHPGTPLAERLTIYDVCLFSGFEDWHLLLERAATIKDSRPAASELEARDLLAFVPKVTEAARSDERLRKGWEVTDQSIKNLSNLLRVHRTGVSVQSVEPVEPERQVLRPAGVLYRVKNYDKRDIDPDGNVEPGQIEDAWEMGHFTQGKYALDSWRIFCRDELLGRAKDWNGGGAAPNFQPEWMRVRPDDKELRACLRWMWMREGWEWDPVTGEKTVLREEMRKAANERRVDRRPLKDALEYIIVRQPALKHIVRFRQPPALTYLTTTLLTLSSKTPKTGAMGSQIDSQDEFVVLVTGFGPFKVQYPVNPSWEIAHSLPSYLPPLRAKNPKDHNPTSATRPLPPVRIVVHPEAIRVNYQTVRGLVPQLWDPATHPRIDATVHIGMAGPRLFYSIERRGHRDGYAFPDVDGKKLEDEERRAKEGEEWVWYGTPAELETHFDLGDVLGRWKAHSPDGSDLRISEDAGHYLCDFIYFSSLAHLWKAQKHRRVVFLHVPSDASEEAVARGTELTVQLIRSVVESELEKRRNKQEVVEPVHESDKIAVELRV